MLSISIELNQNKRIGFATIVNTGASDDPEIGEYIGTFTVTDMNGDHITYQTEIAGFDRSQDAWTLVYEMLKKVNGG